MVTGSLSHVMEANLRALRERQPDHPTLARFDEVGRLLTGSASAQAGEGIAWIQETGALLQVPGLAAWGLKTEDLPTLVEKATAANSMKANPVVLTAAELSAIATSALG